jgi:hypothetical protein
MKKWHMHVKQKDRMFSVIGHVMVWRNGIRRGSRELLLATFAGIPEGVQAVSANLCDGGEITLDEKSYTRSIMFPYRRVAKAVGIGDIAHGCVYHSHFQLSVIEEMKEPTKFKQALLFAPDGDLNSMVSEHVIARFGLPRIWENQYFDLLRDFVEDLNVETNPELDVWKNARAAMFTGDEVQVLELIGERLRDRKLVIPKTNIEGEFDPSWKMQEYIINNAEHLALQLKEKKPRHSFDSPIDPAIADLLRTPFPIQAHMIQALVNAISGIDPENNRKEKPEMPFCGGDMGTGKSIIACGVAYILYQIKKRKDNSKGFAALLSAPGITIPKWDVKEIKKTIPGVKVNIIRSGNDALTLLRKVRRGYKPSGIEFYLVSIDRAKLGYETCFAGVWKNERGITNDIAWEKEPVWHCPECSQPIYVEEKNDMKIVEWSSVALGEPPLKSEIIEAMQKKELQANGIPMNTKVKWLRKAGLPMRCNNTVKRVGKQSISEDILEKYPDRPCGAQLWRPALRARGETRNKARMNISQVLKKTNGFFDLFIQDEAHACKGANSGRGDAFGQMVLSAKATLQLTGTLTNGKSTSIKELIWRTDPKSLLDAGMDYHTGEIDWARRFGKVEEIIYDDEGDVGVVTRRKQKGASAHEGPGIAPQLTAQFLLHKAGFLELADMGLPLVKLREIPVFLDMDEEHSDHYSTFHNNLFDACKKAAAVSGSKGVWSKFNPTTLMYADRPDLDFIVKIGEDTFHGPAVIKEDEYHKKERWLVETVISELSEGRRVMIFNNFTGKYQMNERIRDLLVKNGIRCVILDEPNSELRTEVLDQYEKDEMPVIITNMQLIEVGLDCVYWPTIIFNQFSYKVNTMRQAARRGWRIGQDRECRVYYVAYNGTTQMKMFQHIMRARGHALLVEGRIDKSALAEYSRDGQSSLASDLASCFAGAAVAKAWTDLAESELAGIEMYEESEFKAVLAQRMRDLADQTIRLCGYDPDVWRAEREKQTVILQSNEIQIFNAFEDYDDVDMAANDIFHIFNQETADKLLPIIASDDEIVQIENIRLVTFTELMSTNSNNKKRKSSKVANDQLMWDF